MTAMSTWLGVQGIEFELARFRGDPNILDIGESAAERVPTQCPVKAVAVGL